MLFFLRLLFTFIAFSLSFPHLYQLSAFQFIALYLASSYLVSWPFSILMCSCDSSKRPTVLKHWPPPPRITFPLIGSVWDTVTRQHDTTGWHITEDTYPQLSPANPTENASVQDTSHQPAAGWSLITTCACSEACSGLCVHQSHPTHVLTFIPLSSLWV